jgi:hypothetical protein
VVAVTAIPFTVCNTQQFSFLAFYLKCTFSLILSVYYLRCETEVPTLYTLDPLIGVRNEPLRAEGKERRG